ncbi:MAG: asparagine--tRNA ligase [Planctomycetes bacterium]|nr:asparagine--tRNA ligase [Planctomycetota bacterium]
MQHVYVENLRDHVGSVVTLKGWLYNRRSKGKIHFLQLRDGTGIVQVVMVAGQVPQEQFEAASSLGQESSIIVRGLVKEDARAQGGYEIDGQDLVIVSPAHDYPIQKKEHGPDFLLDHRHLWLRSRKQVALMRVRSAVIFALRSFFDRRGFVNMDAPIFTPNACEGTSTLFAVDYFEETAYLTQSGQLYGEAGAMALGKIYTFGPTFRAEKSKTRRHLTEFWMLEPEVAYADLNDIMRLAEDMLSEVVAEVLARRAPELEILERDTSSLKRVQAPFPRVTYDEAAKILAEEGTGFVYGNDLGAPDETAISKRFDRPVMVTHWPADIKAFYMKRDPADPTKVLGCDVIAPDGYGEIIGGSQREDDLALLEQRIAHEKLPKEAFEWYLDLRRYGSVPHAGFGLGLERLVAWISGTEHVRECIPFPRTIYRMRP